jgi:hypothetical protein
MVDLFALMLVVVCLMVIVMNTGPLVVTYLVELWKSKRTQSHKTKTDHTA